MCWNNFTKHTIVCGVLHATSTCNEIKRQDGGEQVTQINSDASVSSRARAFSVQAGMYVCVCMVEVHKPEPRPLSIQTQSESSYFACCLVHVAFGACAINSVNVGAHTLCDVHPRWKQSINHARGKLIVH